MMEMIGNFSYDGVDAWTEYGLVCKSVKRPLLPKKKVSRKEIAGMSGAIDIETTTYELRQITMKIQYIGTDYYELRSRARSIAAWLYVAGWYPLIILDEPDKKYLAKVTDEIELEGLWESGSADVTFDCQPFAMALESVEESFIAPAVMTKTFTNPGTVPINRSCPPGSEFKIKFVGTWTNLTVTCNGKSIVINAAGTAATLIIDNISMEVTSNGSNLFSSISGVIAEFLEIKPGSNTVTIAGTGVSGTLTVQYTPMWI